MVLERAADHSCTCTGIESIVGPLVTTLPCTISLEDSSSIVQLVRNIQDRTLDALRHQTISLIDLHRTLNLETARLFNTVLSVTPAATSAARLCEDQIAFEFSAGQDLTEVIEPLSETGPLNF